MNAPAAFQRFVNDIFSDMLYVGRRQDDWAEHLPMAEFVINSWTHSALGISPFELTYGYLPLFNIPVGQRSGIPAVDDRIRILREIKSCKVSEKTEIKPLDKDNHGHWITRAHYQGQRRPSIGKTFMVMYNVWRDNLVTRDMEWIQRVHTTGHTLESWMKERGYVGNLSLIIKSNEITNFTFPINISLNLTDESADGNDLNVVLDLANKGRCSATGTFAVGFTDNSGDPFWGLTSLPPSSSSGLPWVVRSMGGVGVGHDLEGPAADLWRVVTISRNTDEWYGKY
ncbi:hypothetical protein F5879DRAFT_1076903 [Lentinula edodes]|nr:hypothetical protein F5879DRAFT_1076903 [Lentinula edodes]